MAIGHKIQNIDTYYESCSGHTILNDVQYQNDAVREDIVDHIRTVHDSEMLTGIAECECKKLRGNFRIGHICTDCKKKVILDKGRFEPDLWCRRLTDVKFIAPKFWMLFNAVISNTVDTLLFMINVNYRSRAKIDPAVIKLVHMEGFDRSYRFVTENMEMILDVLQNTLPVKKREAMMEVAIIYKRDKEILYSNHLPMFTKKLFVTEITGSCKFTQKSIASPINNVMRFMKESHNILLDDRGKELVMAETIASISAIANAFYKDSIAGKFGGSRLNIHAMKAAFSGRCVGTSITRSHDMNNVEIPWGAGLVMFRAQIIGQMIRNYKYDLDSAKRILNASQQKYNKVIDKIMQDIIASSPYSGYPIMMVRNPTLLPSSMLFLGISKVKTNVHDTTVSISVLLMTLFAGDFDGDEYSFGMLPDEFIAEGFKHLEPSRSALSYDKVGEVNGMVTITKATATILANTINKTKTGGAIIKNDIFALK